jgi:thiol-disulfide isomerase/thioredoxin
MRYGIKFILCCLITVGQAEGQSLKDINGDALEAITHLRNDTTYVVNFWATWCSPCVKEIGYFEELHRNSSPLNVKVILVNLDFPNQVESRVLPFLTEREITADVRLMTDLDYDEWIDRIEPGWSGAIPATIIFNKESRLFFEKELSRDQLFNYVTQIRL